MTESQSTPRDTPNGRTRTVTTILLIMLLVMIIMDIFARRRAAAAIRSQRDISLVVRKRNAAPADETAAPSPDRGSNATPSRLHRLVP